MLKIRTTAVFNSYGWAKTRSSAVAKITARPSFKKNYFFKWCNITAISPFKVPNFGNSQKAVYDFLLVNNIDYYHISHHFQVIADYWYL